MRSIFYASSLTFLLGFASLHAHAQSDVKDTLTSEYARLDTLVVYAVNLTSGPWAINCSTFTGKNKAVTYFVDCEKVSYEVYMKYNKANENLGKCKPCYLIRLDKNDSIVSEGPQYTDCRIGTIKEYYPNGTIKCIAMYKVNDTGKWNKLWDRGYCSNRHGVWTWFDESGKIIKTETYKDGELVE